MADWLFASDNNCVRAIRRHNACALECVLETVGRRVWGTKSAAERNNDAPFMYRESREYGGHVGHDGDP